MFRRGRGGCGLELRRRAGGEVTPAGGPGVIEDKSLTVFFLPIANPHPPQPHTHTILFQNPLRAGKFPASTERGANPKAAPL